MTDPAVIERSVLEVVSEVLDEPVANLRAQPVLAAYGWDSIASLEALAQLEARLSVSLDLRSYHAVRTVDALVDAVRDAARTGAAP